MTGTVGGKRLWSAPLAVVALAAVTVATASAAAPWVTGTYREGAQSGFKKPGVHMVITAARFDVVRIVWAETCTATDGDEIHDFAGFQKDSKSKLGGPIKANGDFAGRFDAGQGNYVKVTGHIAGKNLTVSGLEYSRYTPSGSTKHYTCRASGSFHPTKS
jgi:hypothetical protein